MLMKSLLILITRILLIRTQEASDMSDTRELIIDNGNSEYSNETVEEPIKFQVKKIKAELNIKHVDAERENKNNRVFPKEEQQKPLKEIQHWVHMNEIEFTNTKDVKPKKEVIKNSDKQPIDDFPYTVSVQRKGSHYSTGALLHNSWVITSASEYYYVRESIKLFNVRLGSVNCKKGVKIPLRMVEVHPSYTLGLPHYDIALLKLAYPVKFTANIKPISITKKDTWTEFITTYWPRLIINKEVLPSTASERVEYRNLRVCSQRALPWASCYETLRNVNVWLNNTSRCMVPLSIHHSDCMPDVGAPVVVEDGIFGITSGWTSPNCTTNPSPTIYTIISTADIRSWINHIMLLR